MANWDKKYGISRPLRRFLEVYASQDPPPRLLAAARRLLSIPDGAAAGRISEEESELISDYQFEKQLEDADRPISERMGNSQRRLSSRFMEHLGRCLEVLPLKRRLELRAAAGWHSSSDDKVYILHRDGACRNLAEKPRVRALAALLEFKGNPFHDPSQDDEFTGQE